MYHVCVLFFLLITLTRFDLYCCLHIVAWPLHRVNSHPPTHTRSHTLARLHARTPAHTLDSTEIQTIICILPLCASDTQTQSSGGISLAGSASEMSGGFLQPVIKTADTSTSKPPLEYHLSEVQRAAEDAAYKPPCPADVLQNASHAHRTCKTANKDVVYPAGDVERGEFWWAVISPRLENTLITFYVLLKSYWR